MSGPEIKTLPTPVDWTDLFQSRFLHASDLKGQHVTRTIDGVELEAMPDEKRPGKEKRLGSLVLAGEDKAFGLNRTNATCLMAMFGTKLAGWKGKQVTLYPTTTKMYSQTSRRMEDVDCIRVAGSPDIAEDITFDLVLPRKKPVRTTLRKTGAKGNGAPVESPWSRIVALGKAAGASDADLKVVVKNATGKSNAKELTADDVAKVAAAFKAKAAPAESPDLSLDEPPDDVPLPTMVESQTAAGNKVKITDV